MFGSKLKSWMEAHLGRTRHKTPQSHNFTNSPTPNNKHLASVSGSSSTSSPPPPPLVSVTSANSSSVSFPPFPGSVEEGIAALLCPPAPGGSSSMQNTASALSNLSSHINVPTSDSNDGNLLSPSPGSNVVVGATSPSPALAQQQPQHLLLFSHHNLSSPDTGYSTDGYSPKSGCLPALSFESSGKSTPAKSSYTISSLVSSERLHLNSNGSYYSSNTASSKQSVDVNSSSMSHGLDISPRRALLPLNNANNTSDLSEGTPSSVPVGAITPALGAAKIENFVQQQDIQCSNSSSNKGSNFTSDNNNTSKCIGSPIGDNHRLPPPTSFTTFNNNNSNGKNFGHKRAESMGERVGPGTALPGGLVESTTTTTTSGAGPRSIRTSLLIVDPALKTAYSICSPRRGRTRIKTNPWINQDNFHVNYIKSSGAPANATVQVPVIMDNNNTASNVPGFEGKFSENRMEPVETESPPVSTKSSSTVSEPTDVVRYRVSASSDSGKGSSVIDPENRHSVESSQLLTDTTTSTPDDSSCRNSIITEPSNSTTAANTPVRTPESRPALLSPSNSSVSNFSHPSTQVHLPLEKETDILSDWPPTDEDEEAPIIPPHESGNALEDDDGDRTPTPSSPVTAGAQKRFPPDFNHKKTTSTKTHLELFSSPPVAEFIPTTTAMCYPPPPPNLKFATLQKPYLFENLNRIPSSPLGETMDSDSLFPSVGPSILGAGQSKSVARGALGFIRKMFKKSKSTSASSSAGFPGSNKLFRSSSASSRQSDLDNDNNIIPAGLLSPETVAVSNYPPANAKPLSPAINSSFLTPTPNAFRRRSSHHGHHSHGHYNHSGSHHHPSGPGSTCSDSSSSDQHKGTKVRSSIKTDIIRLPQPHPDPVDPIESCLLVSSPRIPYHPMMYKTDSNTNSNSTTASSLNSLSIMSTSTNKSAQDQQQNHTHEFEEEVTPVLAHRQYSSSPAQHHKRSSSSSNQCKPSSSRPNSRSAYYQHQNHNINNYPSPLPRKSSFDNQSPRPLQTARVASPAVYSPMHRIAVECRQYNNAPPTGPPPPPPPPQQYQQYQQSPRTSMRSFGPGSHYQQSPALGGHRTPVSHRTPVLNDHYHHQHSMSQHATPVLNGHQRTSRAASPAAVSHYYLNQNQMYPLQSAGVTCSPSPILRNPRYQYITSSNQNSPLLNSSKRIYAEHERSPRVSSARPLVGHHQRPPSSSSASSGSAAPGYSNRAQVVQSVQCHPYYASPIPGTTTAATISQAPVQHHHQSSRRDPRGPERIYESVDISESDETSRSDEGDGEGGAFEFHHDLRHQQNQNYHYFHQNFHPRRNRGSVPTRQTFQPSSYRSTLGFEHHHHNRQSYSSNSTASPCDAPPSTRNPSNPPRPKPNLVLPLQRLTSESRYSPHAHYHVKEPQQQHFYPARHHPHHQQQQLNMGTFLSETESRLLEDGDSAMDLRYQRLIHEAETLLKEITIQKTNQPWLTHHRPGVAKYDECPQSDPLRRKAYDCWAIRRLQQELAGCCASPPVLHRSRLHITSPMTPSNQNHVFPPPPQPQHLMDHEIPSAALSDFPDHIMQQQPHFRRSSASSSGAQNGHVF